MKVVIENKNITDYSGDLLAVGIFEGEKKPSGSAAPIDKSLKAVISELIVKKEISGKLGTCTVIHTLGKIKAGRVAVVGLGKEKDFDLDAIRTAIASVVWKAKKCCAKNIGSVILGGCGLKSCSEDGVNALIEGAILADYRFRGYKSDEKNNVEIEKFAVIESDKSKSKKFSSEINRAVEVAQAVNRVRDLVNSPSSVITPAYMASYTRKMAKEEGIKCEILDIAEIKKMGMGAFYAVAKGSCEPAKMVILKYYGQTGKLANKEILGLVGKGITFDSGGISIKPAKGLSAMKDDMAGAAAVIESIRVASRLKCKKSIIGVLPLTENMPDGCAFKPGDIVKSLSGKTIEIISTDAEGRLILADAITYAKKLGANKIIDIATLTGGCMISLGDICSAVMGNNQELVDKIKNASNIEGEKLWQMPLFDGYKEYLKSDNADILNCTENSKASSIKGGIFLRNFAEDTPWVHIDIAGTANLDRTIGCLKKGASGVGVRTITKFLLS